MELWFLLTMSHSLGQYYQDQHILLIHYCAYPIQGFLVSSGCPLTELQNVFLPENLFTLCHGVWTKSSFWFDVTFIMK